MWTTGFAVVALMSAMTAPSVRAADFSGDLTSYTLGSTMSGNCNFMAAPAGAAQNYAAINAAQWDSTRNCGRCAKVTCTDSRCKDTTKSEIVYIVDQCPECKQGDLDVSPSVFKSLTGSDPSRYKVSWSFVDCPVTGNLKYCLKSGSNPYFTALQPANAAASVKSVTINAKAATSMVPSAYYYLVEGANIDYSSVKVSLTSVTGETITETVSLTAGSCTTGTRQFSGGASAPSTPSSPSVAPTSAPSPTTKAPKTNAPATKAPTLAPSTKAPVQPKPTTAAPSTDDEYDNTPAPAATAVAPSGDDEYDNSPAPADTPAPTGDDEYSNSDAPAATTGAPTGDDDYNDDNVAPVPATKPSKAPKPTKAPKSKKPKTKKPKTKKPSKGEVSPNVPAVGGDATDAPATKKPVSCRRRED